MVEAKLLRKKLKNGLIVDKWDLVTIIEKQEAEIEALKAHPVKELTLTRDEIRDVWREFPASFTLTPLTIEFARAILRKAQE